MRRKYLRMSLPTTIGPFTLSSLLVWSGDVARQEDKSLCDGYSGVWAVRRTYSNDLLVAANLIDTSFPKTEGSTVGDGRRHGIFYPKMPIRVIAGEKMATMPTDAVTTPLGREKEDVFLAWTSRCG